MKTVPVPAPSLLSTLVEAVPTPVFLLDDELRVRGTNHAGAGLLSRPEDLLVGTPLDRWVVPADLPMLRTSRDEAARTGKPAEVHLRFRCARSQVHPRPVVLHRDAGGGGWVLTARRPPSEEEGRAALDHLRLAFLRSLPRHFLLELSLDGAIQAAHGLDRTHLLEDAAVRGRPYVSLLRGAPGDLESVEDLLASAREGHGWRGVHWHRREDGVHFLVRVYAMPRKPPGHPGVDGVFVSGLDVDRARRETERAERVERAGAVGMLAGRMAARTGRGLQEELERLAGLARGDDMGEVGASVERMRARLGPLVRLTEAFLSLDGRGTERSRPLPVAGLFQGLAQGDHPLPVRWVSDDLPGSLPEVDGPPQALEQVLRLLLDGMAREGGGGDEPTWATGRATERTVVLSFTRQDQHRDDTVVRSLMHPEDAPDLPSAELASARALAVALGARLWTGSGPGPGSTVFSLEIPRVRERGSGERIEMIGDPADDSVRGGGASVLLVDDDPSLRASIGKFLTKAGYEVREAWSGRSAMAQITGGRRPELMVTDLRMLDGSGFWLLEQLERYFPDLLRNTVILTGDEDRGRALSERSGCPLMLKPLELPALVDQLDRLTA